MNHDVIRVDASQPEHTPAGKFLAMLYYSDVLEALVDSKCFSGYPHNGGRHTLYLKLSRDDLRALADILEDQYRNIEGAMDFVAHLRIH